MEKAERELTLKDILVIILKRAKLVAAFALGACLLLGAYGAYRSYSDQQAAAEMAGDTNAAEKYERDLQNAESAFLRAQQQVAEAESYLENSLYYRIDPYNKGVANMLFYVDTGYAVNPALDYQTPDKTGHVVAAYTAMYKYDNELLTKLRELLDYQLDKKYILELISVTNEGNNLVKISVSYPDAEVASQVVHEIYNAAKTRIQQTVAPHETKILTDYAGYEIDTDMRTSQEGSEASLVEALARAREKEEALRALENNTLIKRGIKYGILGGIAGAAVGCILALVIGMMGGRLENAREVMARYKFPLLGILPQAQKGRWLDRWIKNLAGEPKTEYEDAVQVLEANIATVAGDKEILLLSTGDEGNIQKLCAHLHGTVKAGGDILRSAKAVEALQEAAGVILLEERGKAKIEQVDSEVLRLEALHKEILGIVLC